MRFKNEIYQIREVAFLVMAVISAVVALILLRQLLIISGALLLIGMRYADLGQQWYYKYTCGEDIEMWADMDRPE